MPTGYTALLTKGEKVSFMDFMLSIVTDMFGDVTRQGEAGGIPTLTVPKAREQYRQHLERARERLASIEAWDKRQAEDMAWLAYTEEMHAYWQDIEQCTKWGMQAQALLTQAEAWTPPTPGHQYLKDKMISELNGFLEHDCAMPAEQPSRMDGEAYKQEQLRLARKALKSAGEGWSKERKRVTDANNWLKELRQSLLIPAAAVPASES